MVNEQVKITVIILTFNQCATLLRCLASLTAIQEPDFNILVWDNGSQDGTFEAVQRQYPQVHIHLHPRNLGVASGRNAAAAMSLERFHATHLLFLDNDMLLERAFVSALLKPFITDHKVGQTQAKLRFMHDPQRLNDGGGSRINFVLGRTMPVGFNEIDNGQHDTQSPCISCGGAMMVRADVFNQLNGFDMIFDPFGPEDIDFSLRLAQAGYKALYVPDAIAYHEVSHTFGKGYTEDYARHKSRHWFLFMKRHASLWQKMGFFLIGVPFLVARVIIREGKKGNFSALRGLIKGVSDYIRSPIR